MTTLSKEDVMREAFEELYDPDDSRSHWYAFRNGYERGEQAARADIVEANKAIVAENEQMKKQLRQQAEAIASTINKHHTALAAAEADNERLRDALKETLECGEDGDWQSARRVLAAALDQPHDDSTLRRLLAEAKAWVYEECAKVCENSDRYRGDYFAAKIRELAEKAKEEKC